MSTPIFLHAHVYDHLTTCACIYIYVYVYVYIHMTGNMNRLPHNMFVCLQVRNIYRKVCFVCRC